MGRVEPTGAPCDGVGSSRLPATLAEEGGEQGSGLFGPHPGRDRHLVVQPGVGAPVSSRSLCREATTRPPTSATAPTGTSPWGSALRASSRARPMATSYSAGSGDATGLPGPVVASAPMVGSIGTPMQPPVTPAARTLGRRPATEGTGLDRVHASGYSAQSI